jgi:hypothetical protein
MRERNARFSQDEKAQQTLLALGIHAQLHLGPGILTPRLDVSGMSFALNVSNV